MARVSGHRPDSCWEFPKQPDAEYGQFWMKGRAHWAHRVSYVIFLGPLAAGETVNHECLNKRCVNPAHLRKMTLEENSAEASRRRWDQGRVETVGDDEDIGDLPV